MHNLEPHVYDTVTTPLNTAITGLPNFDPSSIYDDPICHHLSEGKRISPDALTAEFAAFNESLEKACTKTLRPNLIKGLEEQMFPRDLGFTIGEFWFVAKMKFASRELEKPGIDKILSKIKSEKIIAPSSDPQVVIEGGDIRVVGGHTIYIGWNDHPEQGRTNKAGVEWLKTQLQTLGLDKQFKLTPLYLNQPNPGEGEVLHLDCAFGPFSETGAVVHEPSFSQNDLCTLKTDYPNLITIDSTEQHALISNFLPSGKIVFSQASQGSKRVNKLMEKAGMTIIEVPCAQRVIAGGTNHCSSADLVRANA